MSHSREYRRGNGDKWKGLTTDTQPRPSPDSGRSSRLEEVQRQRGGGDAWKGMRAEDRVEKKR